MPRELQQLEALSKAYSDIIAGYRYRLSQLPELERIARAEQEQNRRRRAAIAQSRQRQQQRNCNPSGRSSSNSPLADQLIARLNGKARLALLKKQGAAARDELYEYTKQKVKERALEAGASFLAGAAARPLAKYADDGAELIIRRFRRGRWGGVVEHGDTAMQHIRKGHFFNSRLGKISSRFSAKNSNPRRVKELVSDAIANGRHTPAARGNHSIIHTFRDNIGTDKFGRKTRTIQVFLDKDGNVLNAYPIHIQ